MEQSEAGAPKPKPSGISRRNLLKAGFALGIGAAVRSSVPKPVEFLARATVQAPKSSAVPTEETREVLKPIQENVVMIDFAPDSPDERIKQTEYPNNTVLMRAILQDDYVSPEQLNREFGLESLDVQTLDNHNKLRQIPDKYPKAGLIYGFAFNFQNHGERVAETMTKAWQFVGATSKPSMIPAQKLIEIDSVNFRDDELGNNGVFFQINTEAAIEALRKARQLDPNLKVINLSLQLGEMGLVFAKKEKKVTGTMPQFVRNIDEEGQEPGWFLNNTGKWAVRVDKLKDGSFVFVTEDGENIPITTARMTRKEYLKLQKTTIEENTEVVESEYPDFEVMGAYSRDRVEQNIQELFKICEAFPDMAVVAASGNWQDDLRPAREGLSWPSNLIVVGEWHGRELNTNGVEGADIYFSSSLLPSGSSFSTAAVSSIVSFLAAQGLNTEEIKSILMNLTEERVYDIYDPKKDEFVSQTAHILTSNRAIEYLKEQKGK